MKSTATKTNGIINALAPMLPTAAACAVYSFMADNDGAIEEIRLRRNCLWLTVDGENNPLSCDIGAGELSECVMKLCGGSVYAHAATIAEGYIRVDIGEKAGQPVSLRAGICGCAAVDRQSGLITGVRDVSGINIRIPRRVQGCADALVKRMAQDRFGRGVIVYSKPGGGKTTVLRELYLTLCSPPLCLRTSVVDTRGELDVGCRSECADVFTNYPKATGIEIAARTMSAQIIICDEIGEDEAGAVAAVFSMGVPVVMSVHAGSFAELKRRRAVSILAGKGVDCLCAGIIRESGSVQTGFVFNCIFDEK